MTLENGYYWARFTENGGWEIIEIEDGTVWLFGSDVGWDEDEFIAEDEDGFTVEIDPNKIERN